MKKKALGTFIFICGVIVVGLEMVFTVMGLVSGQGLSEGVASLLANLAIGVFLIWFGLEQRKGGKE